jgi:WD40 repeat protein
VVFTADGKSVAVDNGAEVALWDVRTRRRSGPAVAHSQNETPDAYAVIDPHATTVAIGAETGDGPSDTELWDLTTGRRTTSFPVKGKVVALGPGGRTVVTVDHSLSADRYNVRLWDARTGRRQGGAVPSPSGEVGPFSPDGRVVAIGTQLWEVGGTHVGSIGADVGDPISVVAFAGEDTVASLGEYGSGNAVRLWDVGIHQPDHRPLRVGRAEEDVVHGLSADGRTLVTDNTMSDGPLALRTWDVTARQETGPAVPLSADTARTPLAAPPDGIAVAPDGRTFVTGNLYGQLRVWDPVARRGFGLEGGPGGRISAMAISPDGRLLATGGGARSQGTDTSVDGKVQLWDLRTRTLLTERPLFSSGTEVSALAFSRDGRTLAAGIGRTVRLWNVSDRRELAPPLGGINGQAGVLAFGPDNRTLAMATGNTTVLWDVRDRRQIGAPITGHSGQVTALAFSRDGTTLATGGDDHAVNLWNLTDQSRIGAPLVGHTGSVRSLVFNADMTTLTTSDDEATVRRWNIARPADPVAIACAIAGRTLTRAEWAQYVAPGIGYRDVCPSLGEGR